MAGRGRPALSPKDAPRPLLYTAQDVARFCEVDLKTIHHWADRGRIPHHRTEGRHLRFRRNDVVRFLRAHGYPMSEELASARPQVAIAPLPPETTPSDRPPPRWPLGHEDLVRRLSAKFVVRSEPSATVALAQCLALGVDALVVPLDDPELGGARTVAALKASETTSWIAIAAIGDGPSVEAARAAGADVALVRGDLERLPRELAKAMALAPSGASPATSLRSAEGQRPSR